MATFQTYPTPPAYAYYTHRTPPHTPPPAAGAYASYYSPRQFSYSSTPQKGHQRRATGDGATFTYTYTTKTPPPPRNATYYSTPEPTYHTSAQSTPQRKSDYVSGSDRKRESARYSYRVPADGTKQYKFSSTKHYSSRPQYNVHEEYCYDRSYDELPRYEQYESRPPPYKRQQTHEARTDRRYRDQVPIYTAAADATPKASTRTRRASYATKPTNPPPRPRTSTASKPTAKATEDDARRAGIPAGYSFKNWDPTEEPILLLGSVFDANSLGKWIYDWTVFFYGPATPMSEVAGELWLLLIQLAHKIKRAEESMSRIRSQASRDMVDDFLESGERLWQRFNKLLKICENYMWKAAKKESGNSKNVSMGKNSGCEFVDTIFGRDRELDRTEKLMTGMRLWSMRFDANCEDILRNPGA
ncbi:uncharacterized protein MYCFIDRAFT_56947 [Pseudocercospora fijiensis CIRAD86]|uniref:Vegetative cell wall protein gp1 n=1 Tax=Pseudocercospora fijiensis (strain CIRAD86) TaxID=383855 RepID=M3A2U6_PSEFD|nr:uncharacterized protein MYCFIDRAFT_56947 [Pseudocercospora fijiensis CIRAD86]EME78721.1 hypothetical protein MYCFIDRAFT_56947 [Pseudocercospora fijiensis CIRAD86]